MSNNSPVWLGAPPASAEGFSFADGEFFAEASGHNRHRRATLAELRAHFTSGSDKDHPAHWFEAQLLHYGLKPSKTKSVARMRLLDAVNGGDLQVPSRIAKLEAELKKEWVRKSRVAKKALNGGPRVDEGKTTATASKRKKDIDHSPPKTAKKRKATAPATDDDATIVSGSRAARKQTARRGGIAPASSVRIAREASSPAPTKKQTARRGGVSQGRTPRANQQAPSPVEPPRTAQTARRSGAFMARNQIPPAPAQGRWTSDDEYESDSRSSSGGYSPSENDAWYHDEPPPPYSEWDGYTQAGHDGQSRARWY